jgi:energy-coupling factor transporter ATP-binding protein EcfA2
MEIEARKISFSFPHARVRALNELSFSLEAGTCCAILGCTGSGKTTLLLALSGALGLHYPNAPAEGTLKIGAEEFSPIPRRILFPAVGLMLQEARVQISGLRETVYDELKFTLENINLDQSLHKERIESTLNDLGIVELAYRNPVYLSGGQMQRVALGTLLVAKPNIILLDEPTQSLDGESVAKLIRIIRSLKGKATVLFSDNQIDLALSVADFILVMAEGRSLFFGTRRDFVQRLGEFAPYLPVDHWLEVTTSLDFRAPRGLVGRWFF